MNFVYRITYRCCLVWAFVYAISFDTFSQQIIETDTVQIVDNRIYIKVMVNGTGPYNFMFDSGASGMGRIDKRLAERLQLQMVDSTLNSDGENAKREPKVAVSNVAFGSIAYHNLELLCRDYNDKNYEIPIDGIIGRDFFKDYLLIIDCPNMAISISRDSLRRNEDGVLPYIKAYRLEGAIADHKFHFNIDTGSTLAFHIPKNIIQRFNYNPTSQARIGRRANTIFNLQEAVLKSPISLSTFVTKGDILVDYSEEVTQINVGMHFLRYHMLFFDNKNKLVLIK